ncbi:MAG TPA: PQQ-dependent dehydrogenase, methanol/ethanol family [Steroidobacteraceae bacterium]|nr:PQQ-dependent dehydrogenase, methanol/ethanol family [Steroidobacteraceae bacterium]
MTIWSAGINRRTSTLAGLFTAALATVCGARPAADVDDARLLAADREPQNWMINGRTYEEGHFSPLTQINDHNVTRLGLAWYLDVGSRIGTEATPLVVDGVLYTTSVWNIVHAIDARTGRELWRYDPHVDRTWIRHMCCGPANKGAALWKGKVYAGTIDGRLLALDAASGNLVWSTQTTDPAQPYSVIGAPRVFHDKVIIGVGGGEMGVRGYVTAYDAATGKQVWRFYTVPGNPANGFESPTMEMAARTWTGQWWQAGGGGTTWDGLTYDPKLNLVYVGTGNGSPWSRELRSPGGGDNLFLCSIIALNADSGAYRWHYQAIPAESWDYDCVAQMTLAELRIGGRARQVLMQAGKNGFFYVLDRSNGKLISASAFVPVSWASRIDLRTGRPVETAAQPYGVDNTRLLSPGVFGGHAWHAMSYSPLTRLVYIPAQEDWFRYSRTPHYEHTPMAWNLGLNPQARDPPGVPDPPPRKGFLLAWNPATNSEAWRIDLHGPWNGSVLTTAGNLLLQGAADGRFVAYSADKGQRLWDMPIHTGAVAAPIAYSVDGEEYIAVGAGWAGSLPIVGGGMSAAHDTPTRILAFKLGGNVTLPTPVGRAAPSLPASTASPETIERGRRLYAANCRLCHGGAVISGGMIPDLRYMSPQTHAEFGKIVLYGARAAQGMAPFADLLSETDADAIHAYIIEQARPIAAPGAGH